MAIFLWKVTEGKFGIRPAAIFIVNNAYGPDLLGAFLPYDSGVYLFFHGIGWPVIAALLTLLWYRIINGKIYKFRTGKSWISRIHMLEKEKRMKYWQVYLFIAAGGLMHMFIDLIGHPSYIDAGTLGTNVPWGVVWFGDNAFLSLDWVLSTGAFPCGNMFVPVILLTIAYALCILLSIYWGIHTRKFWNFAKGLLLVVSAMFVIYLISYFIVWPEGNAIFTDTYGNYTYYGNPSTMPFLVYLTGGEADLGTMAFMGLLFLLPLFMLYYGFKDLPKGEGSETAPFGDKNGAKEAPAPYLK